MSTVDMSYRMGSYGSFSEGKRSDGRVGRKASEKSDPGRKIAGGNTAGKCPMGGDQYKRSVFAEKVTSVTENAVMENCSGRENASATDSNEAAAGSMSGGAGNVYETSGNGSGGAGNVYETSGNGSGGAGNVYETSGNGSGGAGNVYETSGNGSGRAGNVSGMAESMSGGADNVYRAADCASSENPVDMGVKSTKDMSLEEYAHYIYGIISELERRNYSRGNSVFIYISEEGFRAMQNDPEYEAWVMRNIREAYYYAGHRGGHDGYHSAHFFGATKEEYRGQSWSFGCSKCDQERRQELKRRRKKQLQALIKKRQEQKLLERQRLEKMYLEKRRLEKSVYRKLLVKKTSERERLEEEHQKETLARREAASAFRMYMAILKYNEQ